MRLLGLASISLLLWIAGCTCVDPGTRFRGGNDADTDVDSDTDTDDTQPIETGHSGEPPDVWTPFDDPGDTNQGVDEDGVLTAQLADASGDSNQDQEFFAVLVNTAEGSTGFKVWYSQGEEAEVTDTADGSEARVAPDAEPAPGPSPFRQRLREWRAEQASRASSQPEPASPPPPMPEDDLEVGVTLREFHVRGAIDDDSSYQLATGTLWALGDTVSIWVDDSVGIDWDYECDGVIDEEDTVNDSYGFNNCDLQTIAGIVDANIMVNLEDMLGEFSDINSDERVTVLVTNVLNWLPSQAEDPDEQGAVLESYADPEVDLTDYDLTENPGSDEQEIIYVFAPDPYGFYNPDKPTSVDEYTSMSLAAQVAQEVVHLIIYNQKVLEQGQEDEEEWLRHGIGAVAADLVGFGAIFYDDAWDYMDAPHLASLTAEKGESSLSLEGRGAQYLFLRYLVDVYGTEILGELVQSTEVGTSNVEAAVAELGGPEDFDEIVLQWQVALAVTGQQNIEGEDLVDESDWPQYAEAETISAPTEPPESAEVGVYYGANGYQTGLNLNGLNRYMEDGTTDSPAELEDKRVLLGNTDFSTYVPGIDFFGSVIDGFGAQVVRLSNLTYDETALNIQVSNAGLLAAIIRWNDPLFDDIAVEEIYSSVDANYISLPSLPEDGTPIYGIGEIGEEWQVDVYSADGGAGDGAVYDTDRWLLDFSDRPLGEEIELQIWLDRRYENLTGSIAPFDPWLALAPFDWVPTPTVDDTNRDACPDLEGTDFEFPVSLLEFIFNQQVLSWVAFSEVQEEEEEEGEGGEEEGDTERFDPCGITSGEPTTCADDWDGDSVPDADEPAPDSFQYQVLVQLCSIDPDLLTDEVYGLENFDVDSVDEDELPTIDYLSNAGGRSDDSGEDAYLEITATGGEAYLLVVGAGADTGPYEFSVRQVVD